MKLPRMLHAKVLGSPHAHARIKSHRHREGARSYPGVEAVITAADLPAVQEEPIEPPRRSSSRTKRCCSTASRSSAVLASDPHVAEEALGLIEVEYEVLPAGHRPDRGDEAGRAARSRAAQRRRPLGGAGHVTVERRGEGARPQAQQHRLARRRSSAATSRPGSRRRTSSSSAPGARRWSTRATSSRTPRSPTTTRRASSRSGPARRRRSTSATNWPDARHPREPRSASPRPRCGGGFGGKIYLTELMVAAARDRRAAAGEVHHDAASEDMLAATPAPFAQVELKTGMKRTARSPLCRRELVYDSGAFPGAPVLAGLPARRRLLQLREPRHRRLRGADQQGQRRRPPRARRAQRHVRHREPHGHDGEGARPRPDRGAPQERRRRGRPRCRAASAYPRIGLRECLEAIAESDVWKRRAPRSARRPTAASVSPSVAGWAAFSRRARSSA